MTDDNKLPCLKKSSCMVVELLMLCGKLQDELFIAGHHHLEGLSLLLVIPYLQHHPCH